MGSRVRWGIVGVCLAVLLGGCQEKYIDPNPGGAPQDGGTRSESVTEKPVSFDIAIPALNKRIPVIMYHDIIEERGRQSVWFDCTVEEFSKQLELIQVAGYTPISLKQLHEHLTGQATEMPEKPIVLTFDDNYQGFYDYALPLLKENQFPAAIFVHTNFVGNTEGAHPKMTWDTLRELIKDPLITIGSHTVTHPNLEGMDEFTQRHELEDSKKDLEEQLGIKIDYLAYPEGKYDETSVQLTKELGYTMAVTVSNGPAELSPSILTVNRYIHTRLEKAIEECEQSLRSAPGVSETELKIGSVTFEVHKDRPNDVVMAIGGQPRTILSESRENVSQFIERTPGAAAGINGTFFAMAAIASTDNQLVGPCVSPETATYLPDTEKTRWDKLRNRPVVMWDDKRFVIVPFNPELMSTREFLDFFMPEPQAVFMGGAWLVHEGAAIPKEDMTVYASKDIMDFRRRAAFGVMMDGRPVAAATRNSVTSENFAEALAKAGVKEAVLLDSGFSTSLVFAKRILASGHSSKDSPSRPVPHAILLMGEAEEASVTAAMAEPEATAPNAERSSGRRSRRRR